MQIENTYIGDDKFKRFLEHYNCPTDIEEVKLKFAGAICSPNKDLRPTDVISSLFRDNQQPRLETKSEAELFFKFFMGLWDEMFIQIKTDKLPDDMILPTSVYANKDELSNDLYFYTNIFLQLCKAILSSILLISDKLSNRTNSPLYLEAPEKPFI